ncbi:hypothetical protein LEP1GSC041_0725 [Leptospira noguchii str. 2006001870]|nr:hypothetical protein LEP1GSC041_0725 [Leptospira noguchii str. 2006001870]
MKSLPVQRLRRAFLHLQYSYADFHQLRDTPPAVRSNTTYCSLKRFSLSKRDLKKEKKYKDLQCGK